MRVYDIRRLERTNASEYTLTCHIVHAIREIDAQRSEYTIRHYVPRYVVETFHVRRSHFPSYSLTLRFHDDDDVSL